MQQARWALPSKVQQPANHSTAPPASYSYGNGGAIAMADSSFARTAPAAPAQHQHQAQHQGSYGRELHRVAPHQYASYNRSSAPNYVQKSIPGYAGYIPSRQFLKGAGTFGQETDLLGVFGSASQPLQPREVPQRFDNFPHAQHKHMPGYAGHVSKQRFTCGNFRVKNFQQFHKGEVRHGSLFNYAAHDRPTNYF